MTFMGVLWECHVDTREGKGCRAQNSDKSYDTQQVPAWHEEGCKVACRCTATLGRLKMKK